MQPIISFQELANDARSGRNFSLVITLVFLLASLTAGILLIIGFYNNGIIKLICLCGFVGSLCFGLTTISCFKAYKKYIKKVQKDDKKIELSKEDLQWNKMWDLWLDEKIEPPYYELMDYLNGVNNGGHHCHFDNTFDPDNKPEKEIKEYVENLKTILPEPLKANVETAYKAYIANPNDVSEENSEILSNCDDVYYKHEELVNQILKERAKIIKL